jgi:mannitol/fructose-specific phosphotransferase system IIA component (Ntr-type)
MLPMNFARYLQEDSIDLAFDPEFPEPVEGSNPDRYRQRCKEQIIGHMAELLARSGRIVNSSKLVTDLINRERKASTAIGHNLAMPHVRTAQAKDFIVAFARCQRGIGFDSIDGEPVFFFLALVAPSHDDRLYQKVYRRVGGVFSHQNLRDQLMAATQPGEVIRILSRGF